MVEIILSILVHVRLNMASKLQNHGEPLSQVDKQDARTSRDSKKCKQIDRVEKESSGSETRKPKCCKTTKVMPK